MKNKNYYSIHKNKKKRKSTLTEGQKASKLNGHTILSCLRIFFRAIEVAKALKASKLKRMPIPDYTKGGIYSSTEMTLMDNGDSIETICAKDPYFDPNVTINLPDNIPLNIGYEKNSYQEFKKNNSFEM